MADISTTKTKTKITVYLKDGDVIRETISNQIVNTAGDNTEGISARSIIAAGTADTTQSLGNMASCDTLQLICSEEVDAIYFSTIVGAELIGVGCKFLYASGLTSEPLIHIDGTSTSADVTVDMLALSNE